VVERAEGTVATGVRETISGGFVLVLTSAVSATAMAGFSLTYFLPLATGAVITGGQRFGEVLHIGPEDFRIAEDRSAAVDEDLTPLPESIQGLVQ
jgi:hypothetical protein